MGGLLICPFWRDYIPQRRNHVIFLFLRGSAHWFKYIIEFQLKCNWSIFHVYHHPIFIFNKYLRGRRLRRDHKQSTYPFTQVAISIVLIEYLICLVVWLIPSGKTSRSHTPPPPPPTPLTWLLKNYVLFLSNMRYSGMQRLFYHIVYIH